MVYLSIKAYNPTMSDMLKARTVLRYLFVAWPGFEVLPPLLTVSPRLSFSLKRKLILGSLVVPFSSEHSLKWRYTFAEGALVDAYFGAPMAESHLICKLSVRACASLGGKCRPYA